MDIAQIIAHRDSLVHEIECRDGITYYEEHPLGIEFIDLLRKQVVLYERLINSV